MIMSLAFSPDGRRLASSTGGDTKVWDVASGQELRTIKGTGMAFSPDGRRLASATREDTVMVWDAESGQELCTRKGHRDQVHNLVFDQAGHSGDDCSRCHGLPHLWPWLFLGDNRCPTWCVRL
jgi:WD40 repeat protein